MAGSTRQVAIEYVGKAAGLIGATKQAEKSLSGFSDAAEAEGEKAGTGLGSKLKSGLEKTSAGLDKVSAGIGLAAGAALGGALLSGIDNQKAVSKVSAQLGLTKKESAAIGKVAGNLYSQAYGESMEDVSGAVASVRSSIKGMNTASSKDLESVTKNAIDFASAMGVDVGEAAVSAGTLVNTGLAKNGKQAFDLLTAGAQAAGPQMTAPLLDATNEYSKHFKMLGFSGEQAMGILATASSGGEIAIDKAGDAIKELGIRATDLGDTGAQEALADLGLNGQRVGSLMLKGGKGAQTATKQIAEGLLNVKNPAEQAKLATALFGTQAEDIGKDNMPGFLKALTGAETGLGKVKGRANEMGKTLNDNAATNIEQYKRQITTTFVDIVGNSVIPTLTVFTGFLANNETATKATLIVVGVLAGAVLGLNAALKVANAVTTAAGVAQTIYGAAVGNATKKGIIPQTAAMVKNAAIWVGQKTAMLAAAAAQKAVTAAQWLMNAAMSANPIGIVVVAIAALVAGLTYFFTKTELGRKIWSKFSGAIVTGAKAVVGWVTGKFVPFFTKTLPGAIAKPLNWAKKNWPTILAILTGPVGLAVLAITKNWGRITGAFTKAKKWVSGTWKKGWAGAKGWIGGAVEKGRDVAGAALGLKKGVQAKFAGAKSWVSGTWKKGWSSAKGWISGAVERGRDAAGTALGKGGLRKRFGDLKTWTGTTWKKGWKSAKGWIADPVGSAKTLVGQHKDKIRAGLKGLDTWGRKIFGPNWDKMKSRLSKPIKDARDYFARIFSKGAKGGFLTLFSDMVSNAGRIFGRIKDVLVAPIKSAIGVINTKLIKGGINWILGKLGVAKKNMVPWIPVPKLRTGGGVGAAWRKQIGRIHGPGGPRADKVPLLGSAGEHMWSAVEVAKAGGHAAMEKMRSAARRGQLMLHDRLPRPQGLAGGGPVQPVPGQGNRHTSGYPWATWAGDFPVGMGTPIRAWKDGVVAMVKHLTYSYGQHLRMNHTDGSSSLYAHMSKIIGRVGQQLDAGAVLGQVGSTGNSTGPHLHFETMGKPYSGGSGGGLVDKIGDVFGFLKGLSPAKFLGNLAGKLVGKLPGDVGGIFGRGLTNIPKLIVGKAKDWIADKITSFGASGSEWSGGKVGSWDQDQLNNAATIISVAKRLGFGHKGALIGLITAMQESTLRNLGYGDRDSVGLFQQRTPWGPRADRMNPAKSASMFYLGGQGGQPGLKSKPWQSMSPGAAAQAVQVSAFPSLYAPHIPKAEALLAKSFDTGGKLPTGLTLVHNGTGRQETVRTADQEARLHSQPTEIHIHVDGTMNDDRTIGKLIHEIERYQRRRGPVRLVRNGA